MLWVTLLLSLCNVYSYSLLKYANWRRTFWLPPSDLICCSGLENNELPLHTYYVCYWHLCLQKNGATFLLITQYLYFALFLQSCIYNPILHYNIHWFVNFEFRVTKKVEASKEFQEVQVETNHLIKEFKLNLKAKIMDALKIEILQLCTELYSNLFKILHSIIQVKLLSDLKDFNCTCNHEYNYTLSRRSPTRLLWHKQSRVLRHLLWTPRPARIPTLQCCLCSQPRWRHHARWRWTPQPQTEGAQNQTQAVKERDLTRICLDMIWSTSIHPTDSYFDQLEEIETDISLKKLHFEAENNDM